MRNLIEIGATIGASLLFGSLAALVILLVGGLVLLATGVR